MEQPGQERPWRIKASELVERLQKQIEEHGDGEVTIEETDQTDRYGTGAGLKFASGDGGEFLLFAYISTPFC